MRIALIEDTYSCAVEVQELLERFSRETEIATTCEYFPCGTDFLNQPFSDWDLILLDIEMPEMNGLEIAHKIRETDSDVLIIFITHMAQYAIEGYSVQAFDYILKPVNYYSFSMKLQQVASILQSREVQFLVISSQNGKIRLPLDTLRYVEIYDHTLIYHTTSGTFSSTSYRSLGKLEKALHSTHFSRCHNGYLVNLAFVSGYEKSEVFLGEHTSLPLSRTYSKSFLGQLLSYWRNTTI